MPSPPTPIDVVQEVAQELYRWRAEYEGWTVAWESPVVDQAGYLREAEQLCAIMARKMSSHQTREAGIVTP